MKTLILTDNPFGLGMALDLLSQYGEIDIFQSSGGRLNIPELDINSHMPEIISNYGLVLSIHCKQIFPSNLVEKVRCINIHPGFNPHNRGWFPHVFSIINGRPAGVTIHVMDKYIDHGGIIVQRECKIEPWDTSLSLYEKIMKLERELLFEYYLIIRDNTYQPFHTNDLGSFNQKKDFEALRRINLDEQGDFRKFVNRLRALSHGEYRNAYFIDDFGQKIYIKVVLEPETQ
jgi:methionyl-tRNA formyltransferase